MKFDCGHENEVSPRDEILGEKKCEKCGKVQRGLGLFGRLARGFDDRTMDRMVDETRSRLAEGQEAQRNSYGFNYFKK